MANILVAPHQKLKHCPDEGSDLVGKTVEAVGLSVGTAESLAVGAGENLRGDGKCGLEEVRLFQEIEAADEVEARGAGSTACGGDGFTLASRDGHNCGGGINGVGG